MHTTKRPLWLEFLLIILMPVAGMALGVGITMSFGLNQTDYSNLVVNLFLLATGIILVFFFKFPAADLGLKLLKEQASKHVVLSLAVFIFYTLFYIFVIRVSSLKPFSARTYWGLLTFLVVVFAEELYFRGALYAFLEKRFSAKTALIASSILFGLFHARQGVAGILAKSVTGWLWGSIRYATGMIFLVIFPIHFMYNAAWLLFEGNWNNPPIWANYILPTVEFVLGLVIVATRGKKSEN